MISYWVDYYNPISRYCVGEGHGLGHGLYNGCCHS